MTEPGGSAKDSVEFDYEFEAEMPFRWTWEDADTLNDLSDDDRQVMLKLFARLDKAFRSGDPDAVLPVLGRWATVDR